MTFKIKAGINVGNVNVIDTNARYQQVLGVPNTQPTLNLDFINNPSLESRSTISRTSNGTFVDARGLVATASSNTARFEYANGLPRGLLIENQRSNLAIYSEDFTFSSYVKNGSSTVIPYATIAPDGSLTGALWTSSGSVGSGFYRFVASLVGVSHNVTASTDLDGSSDTAEIDYGIGNFCSRELRHADNAVDRVANSKRIAEGCSLAKVE